MVSTNVILLVLAGALCAAGELHPLSDDFIDLINSKQTTWKAGRNFPRNTPLQHLKALLGAQPYEEDPSLPRLKHGAEVIDNLPETFDSRENWPNCPSIREIRDQGSCGSCWAVSAAEVMTDRVCIYSNGTKQFHFSAGDLLSCCTYCGNGCKGGFSLLFPWVYWKDNGIVSGGNYNSSQGCKPYPIPPCGHDASGQTVNSTEDKLPCTPKATPACSTTCDVNYGVSYENDKIYGKDVSLVTDGEDAIKAELYLNGPVVVLFDVHVDFYSYKSGVYQPIADSNDFVSVHAFKLIGWGVENGVKYWLVANSWNSGWGDNGFVKVARGKNVCGIEKVAIAGEPLLTE